MRIAHYNYTDMVPAVKNQKCGKLRPGFFQGLVITSLCIFLLSIAEPVKKFKKKLSKISRYFQNKSKKSLKLKYGQIL